jgi:L,D-transpeptidase YnhG
LLLKINVLRINIAIWGWPAEFYQLLLSQPKFKWFRITLSRVRIKPIHLLIFYPSFRFQDLSTSVGLFELIVMLRIFTSLLAASLCLPLFVNSAQAQPTVASGANPTAARELLELPPLGSATGFLPDAQQVVRVILDLGKRRIFLYSGEQLVADYPVAVGKPGWETPIGSFQITHKVRNPVWESPMDGTRIPPGPDNPLGDRLLVFAKMAKGFAGIHGTTNESLIGQAVSHGCVRMRNRDIRALFEKVQVGTPVLVVRSQQ